MVYLADLDRRITGYNAHTINLNCGSLIRNATLTRVLPAGPGCIREIEWRLEGTLTALINCAGTISLDNVDIFFGNLYHLGPTYDVVAGNYPHSWTIEASPNFSVVGYQRDLYYESSAVISIRNDVALDPAFFYVLTDSDRLM